MPYGEAPAAAAKAQRPWWNKKRFIILIVLVVLLIAASAGGSSDDDKPSAPGIDTNSGNQENPPQDDIGVSGSDWNCEVDDVGWGTASGTLTNHSSGTSSYIIEVTFTAGGTPVRHRHRVREQRRCRREVRVGGQQPRGSPVWDPCNITDVDRFAS